MADSSSSQLVPDPAVAEEFGVSLMSIWRWTNDPDLRFPPPIQIRHRNYRSRAALDEWRERMVREGARRHAEVNS